MGALEDDLPMHIREVYLFGSFLTEKDDPTDLDLLLLYDPDLTAEKYTVEDERGTHWKMGELARSPSRLRGRLKRNSERSVDLSICPSLEAFQRDLEHEMTLYLCLWTREERDWRDKLNAYFGEG